MKVRAWIEIPDDPVVAAAFAGDSDYSPLGMTLGALQGAGIHDVTLSVPPEIADWPAMPAGVRVVRDVRPPDVAERHAGVRLRHWCHAGSLHGPMMTTEYCTYGNPAAVLRDLSPAEDDLILVMSARHGMISQAAIQHLIDYAHRTGRVDPIYLCDGPPGMFPLLATPELLRVMSERALLVQGFLLPRGRYWGGMMVHLPTGVVSCRRSLLLDSERGRRFCRAVASRLAAQGCDVTGDPSKPSPTLEEIVAAANAETEAWIGEWPADIELEAVAPDNRPLTIATAESLFAGVGEWHDSINLTIGGRGDPLAHPDLPGLISAITPHVRGLSLRIPALTDRQDASITRLKDRLQALSDLPIDIISLHIADYPKAGSDIPPEWTALSDHRRQQLEHGDLLPLAVVELHKTPAADISVVDFWRDAQVSGLWPLISPAGVFGDAGALSLFPASRKPCIRLSEQMQIRADGRVPMCRPAGFAGGPTVGNALNDGIAAVWRNSNMEAARSAHNRREWAAAWESCSKCNAWHELA